MDDNARASSKPFTQENYRMLFETMSQGVVYQNHDGTILAANPAAQNMLGLTLDQMQGRTPSDLRWNTIHEDGADFPVEAYPSMVALRTGKPVQQVVMGILHPQAAGYQWLTINAAPQFKDGESSPYQVYTIFEDITERKAVRERLQQSEKRFRALIEHGSDAIMLFDRAGHILFASPSITRILGYEVEELLGRFTLELFYPDNCDFAQNRFVYVLQNPGKTVYEQFRLLHKDGTLRLVEGIGLNLLDDPAVGAVAVNFRDITERKLLEAELQTTKEQLEAIFQNIDSGIILQDAHGGIVYANQAAAHITGYSSVQEMLQMPALSYWGQFDITDEQGKRFSTTQAPGRRAIQGETVPPIALCATHKRTRKKRWVLLKSTAIAVRDQVPAFVITLMQDITQFKELEQRKDEFVMHVSHELRTPLTAVSGYLSLLRDHDEKLDTPTRGMFLERALTNCDELALLVNSVLDALYITSNMHVPHYEELSVSEVVHEALNQLDPRQKAAYSLEVQIPEQLIALADKQFLLQILRNLLSNSFKYAPRQTVVTLSATVIEDAENIDAERYICIRVQDAGPGIPPAEQPLLFQKFARLKRDLSGKVRGTGLGLHNCKKLVEAMGGLIWVESTGLPGEGSCFCFTIREASTPFVPHIHT